jgi:hypothetical protein
MTPDPTPHPDDALVDLATGLPVADDVRAHLEGCPRCARELAALREVVGLVREPAPALTAPPAGVWSAVLEEVDRDDRDDPAGDRGVPAPLDEPSPSVVVPLRRDRRAAPPVPRVRGWWVAAAAAAGLVVGGAGAGLLLRDGGGDAPVVVAETDLDTLDTDQVLGAARTVRVDGHLDLDVDTPAIDAGQGYLEVWLINRDLTRMVSVGVLRPGDGSQRFAIDQALIDQGYVIVDISREGFDDRPEHSGDSVARGTLGA